MTCVDDWLDFNCQYCLGRRWHDIYLPDNAMPALLLRSRTDCVGFCDTSDSQLCITCSAMLCGVHCTTCAFRRNQTSSRIDAIFSFLSLDNDDNNNDAHSHSQALGNLTIAESNSLQRRYILTQL